MDAVARLFGVSGSETSSEHSELPALHRKPAPHVTPTLQPNTRASAPQLASKGNHAEERAPRALRSIPLRIKNPGHPTLERCSSGHSPPTSPNNRAARQNAPATKKRKAAPNNAAPSTANGAKRSRRSTDRCSTGAGDTVGSHRRATPRESSDKVVTRRSTRLSTGSIKKVSYVNSTTATGRDMTKATTVPPTVYLDDSSDEIKPVRKANRPKRNVHKFSQDARSTARDPCTQFVRTPPNAPPPPSHHPGTSSAHRRPSPRGPRQSPRDPRPPSSKPHLSTPVKPWQPLRAVVKPIRVPLLLLKDVDMALWERTSQALANRQQVQKTESELNEQAPARQSTPQADPDSKARMHDDTAGDYSSKRKRVQCTDSARPSDDACVKKRKGEDDVKVRNVSSRAGSSREREEHRVCGADSDSPSKETHTAAELKALGNAIEDCGETKVSAVIDAVSQANVKGWQPKDAAKYIRGVATTIEEVKWLSGNKGKVDAEEVVSFMTVEAQRAHKSAYPKNLSVRCGVDGKAGKCNPKTAKGPKDRKRKPATLINEIGKRVEVKPAVSQVQAEGAYPHKSIRGNAEKRGKVVEGPDRIGKRTESTQVKIKLKRSQFKGTRVAYGVGRNRDGLGSGREHPADAIADGRDLKAESEEDEIRGAVGATAPRQVRKARQGLKKERVAECVRHEYPTETVEARKEAGDGMEEKECVEEELQPINQAMHAEEEMQVGKGRVGEKRRQAAEKGKAVLEEGGGAVRKSGGSRRAKGSTKARARK